MGIEEPDDDDCGPAGSAASESGKSPITCCCSSRLTNVGDPDIELVAVKRVSESEPRVSMAFESNSDEKWSRGEPAEDEDDDALVEHDTDPAPLPPAADISPPASASASASISAPPVSAHPAPPSLSYSPKPLIPRALVSGKSQSSKLELPAAVALLFALLLAAEVALKVIVLLPDPSIVLIRLS